VKWPSVHSISTPVVSSSKIISYLESACCEFIILSCTSMFTTQPLARYQKSMLSSSMHAKNAPFLFQKSASRQRGAWLMKLSSIPMTTVNRRQDLFSRILTGLYNGEHHYILLMNEFEICSSIRRHAAVI
jgi:hypothetical protein